MSVVDPTPEPSSAAVQTPHVASVIASCEICGKALGPRALNPRSPQRTCSNRCRAIRWRQHGEATQRAEVESLCQAVRQLRLSVDALSERVDRMAQRAPRRSDR
jgi:hypothetical protein